MENKDHFKKLENMYFSGPINKFYDPRIKISEGSAEISVSVKEDFFHAAKAVHGSVYFKSLDDSAFFAANSIVEDVFVLTVNFNVYITRPISQGEIIAHGKLVHKSKRFFIAESFLLDSEGREIARGSGSFMKSKIPLDYKIGYK